MSYFPVLGYQMASLPSFFPLPQIFPKHDLRTGPISKRHWSMLPAKRLHGWKRLIVRSSFQCLTLTSLGSPKMSRIAPLKTLALILL